MKMKNYIGSGILLLFVMTLAILVAAQSGGKESIDGEGTLVNEDKTHSQFSFSAKRNPNGKVTGKATIKNPSYKNGNGQSEKITIDITCLKVIGKAAIIGGTTKRKNNQAKSEAVYFAVEDNGAAGDGIFRGFYFDDDPATEGDAQRCLSIEPEVAVFEPIVGGKITVKDK